MEYRVPLGAQQIKTHIVKQYLFYKPSILIYPIQPKPNDAAWNTFMLCHFFVETYFLFFF